MQSAVLSRFLVSIPERVLEALKLHSRSPAAIADADCVSIPERVLEALKRGQFFDESGDPTFQSLKGF